MRSALVLLLLAAAAPGAGQPEPRQFETDKVPWATLGRLSLGDDAAAAAGPLGMPADFWQRRWEREPTHIRWPAGAFAQLFEGEEDLEQLLSDAILDDKPFELGKNVKVVLDGRKGRASGILDFEKLQEFFSMRATVVFDGVEKSWKPVRRLAKRVERWAGVRAEVNMYRTPPEARGFGAHYDFEDVFIVQVQGSKRWRVWEPDAAVAQVVTDWSRPQRHRGKRGGRRRGRLLRRRRRRR